MMRRGRGMVGGGAGAHDESHRYRVAHNCIEVYDLARTDVHSFIHFIHSETYFSERACSMGWPYIL